MSQNGKGSRPRPIDVALKEYRDRWDDTFKRDAARGAAISEVIARTGRLQKLPPPVCAHRH